MISIEEVSKLIQELYAIKGDVKSLPGEVDYNYKVEATSQEAYTLKISRDDEEEQWINLQCSVLLHLNNQDLELEIPSLVPTLQGDPYSRRVLSDGKSHFVRMQKWVEGSVMADQDPQLVKFLNQLGGVAGSLSQSLSGFMHRGAKKIFNWDNDRLLEYMPYIEYFDTSEQENIALYFFEGFEQNLNVIRSLRKSVCYNDLNDHNILTCWEDGDLKINGIIDFGDVLYTQTVNEVAIACAYAGMHQYDPLEAFTHIVDGYHNSFPLLEDELKVLYFLIGARLVISVCRSAYNKRQDPENQYLVISEQPAWKLLKKWRAIHPEFAHFRFRAACGLTPCPKETIFQSWIGSNLKELISPIHIGSLPKAWLNLSLDSREVGHMAQFETTTGFEKFIRRYLEDEGAEIGWGGYGETRMFYGTEAYRERGNCGFQWRSVHLGLDIWAPEGTDVIAPMSGSIYSVANHLNHRDYGGTLILKHQVSADLEFYTLYGHLAWRSIKHWQEGAEVQPGEAIASLGGTEENGGWPPHLHFQVILNLLDWKHDFPGVCLPQEKEVWKSISPYIPFFDGLSSDQDQIPEIITTRKKVLGPSLSLSYETPLHIVRGYKQYLYDHRGQQFLDTVNNVAHVGHEHPQVVEAGQKQMAILNTNTRYLHHEIIQYAQNLLSTFPPSLAVCYFVNSGSEANELALRMARTFQSRKDMIALEVGYHGNTGSTIDISSYKFDQPGGAGKPRHTQLAPIPDTYRGLYQNPREAGALYADHIDRIIEEMDHRQTQPAGFIAESILSCGGQIELPTGFLKRAYQSVRDVGGLCIADEVQVGFGRVGHHFWGFELSGVVPDIVTLGKPIGNGHPLGAVVCTREVADAFDNGMEYFNTFGGNPVSCAIGQAVLDVIRDEKLQKHALDTGNYIKSNLKALQNNYPIIGDIRGQGLFLGFELVQNPETKEPAPQEADYLINRMRSWGYLMSTDGPDHNVIKIKPPMCISRKDVDEWIETLDKIFREGPMRM